MSFWSDEVIQAAEEGASFEAMPAGNYTMMLSDCEIKTTKAGDGNYLKLVFEVTGPTHEGRKVFDNVTVKNKNAQSVGIGLGHLKELATAAGNIEWYEKLKAVSDWDEAETLFNGIFDELGNIEVVGNVTVRKSEQYGDQNEVKRFKAAPSAGKPAAAKTGKKSDAPWD